ncbi:MAG: ABC transporter [Rhodospirillaceae bacterium]|nr:ABC transporter [Rhodospirillaceae bacterium]
MCYISLNFLVVRWSMKNLLIKFTITIIIVLVFCKISVSHAEEQTPDPFEKINRAVFVFNDSIDTAFLKPIATLYSNVPEPGRNALRNIFRNLETPIILTNNILQVDIYNAQTTTLRFFINTIFGLGGIFDTASKLGIERNDTNFGETLEKYGFGPGFYIVLPILGPSTFRDAIGIGVDQIIDPLNISTKNIQNNWLQPTKTSIRGIDFRERNLDTLDNLKETSLDYYATLRSLYLQRRKNIKNNDNYAIPSLDLDDDDDLNDDGTCCVYVETSKDE